MRLKNPVLLFVRKPLKYFSKQNLTFILKTYINEHKACPNKYCFCPPNPHFSTKEIKSSSLDGF